MACQLPSSSSSSWESVLSSGVGFAASCSLLEVGNQEGKGTRVATHFERVDRGPFVKSGYWLLVQLQTIELLIQTVLNILKMIQKGQNIEREKIIQEN